MKSRDELFSEAQKLEADGNEHAALQIWRELAERHPDPTALCRIGWLAQEFGEIDEAERAFHRAIKLDSGLGRAYLGLGFIAIHKREYHDAECFLRQAVRFDKTKEGYTMLGVALTKLDRDQEAKQSYLKAIEIGPEFEEPYYNLGVLLRNSDPVEAKALFSKALILDPNYSAAHRELGLVFRKQDRWPEAEVHLRRAIELQPDDGWAHIYLGNLLWEMGETAAAVTEFQWAHEAQPEWAAPLWALANVYESQEEWGKAQTLYEQALALEPDDVEANMNLGRMLMKKGDPAAAKVYLERALLLNPSDAKAKALLAELE